MVDSGASMHMVSRKDLNSAALETVRVSENPTTVVTANGEVPTKEEATVYVRELDLFVTVMLLEDTPALRSLENSAKITGRLSSGPVVKNQTQFRQRNVTENSITTVVMTQKRGPWSFVTPGSSKNSAQTDMTLTCCPLFR